MTIQNLLLDNHQLAQSLCDRFPGVRKDGFRRVIREIAERLDEDLSDFRRVPDAFVVRDGDIDVFEVECTHPLPRETLADWCRLWSALDFHGIELALYVVNRYGHINQVNLMFYWQELCLVPHAPRAGDADGLPPALSAEKVADGERH